MHQKAMIRFAQKPVDRREPDRRVAGNVLKLARRIDPGEEGEQGPGAGVAGRPMLSQMKSLMRDSLQERHGRFVAKGAIENVLRPDALQDKPNQVPFLAVRRCRRHTRGLSHWRPYESFVDQLDRLHLSRLRQIRPPAVATGWFRETLEPIPNEEIERMKSQFRRQLFSAGKQQRAKQPRQRDDEQRFGESDMPQPRAQEMEAQRRHGPNARMLPIHQTQDVPRPDPGPAEME